MSTNLGPVSREVNTFGAYYGCHKSCHIFKMTRFHFKSSNFTISPLFPHLKDVKKQIFQNEHSNGVSRPLLQRPTWLAKKTIGLFRKTTENQPIDSSLVPQSFEHLSHYWVDSFFGWLLSWKGLALGHLLLVSDRHRELQTSSV